MSLSIGIVGAGFSGAVLARELALCGHRVSVYEARSHVAGNCHTYRDVSTGVMVHAYGPHIFHTSNQRVWDYVQQFDVFQPFINRVKTVVKGKVYSLPVNLMTINQFYGQAFSPSQARDWIASVADKHIRDPQTFEEQALAFVGKDLYEAFFKGYTTKQWGVHPSGLPASILKRLPVRFDYNDNYYASTYQGMPIHGYTAVVEKMLDHPLVSVHLSTPVDRSIVQQHDHVFYAGPLDAWFGHSEGRLGYRTLRFEQERHEGDYQGNAVINYGDVEVPWTRISEHKHFAPWETHASTLVYKEYSALCGEKDIPYYPIRLTHDKALLSTYVAKAKQERKVTFVGRLGTYRYLDMHVTVAEALQASDMFKEQTTALGPFTIDPLA